jgi:hypothetical protein
MQILLRSSVQLILARRERAEKNFLSCVCNAKLTQTMSNKNSAGETSTTGAYKAPGAPPSMAETLDQFS